MAGGRKRMKSMKNILALLLAAVMLLALSTTAVAANGTNDNSGTVTIENAIVGQTYSIYQILKLESYDTEATDYEGGAYAYKAATQKWSAFLSRADVKGVYVNIDAQGYVTWVEGADAAAFARKALTFANNHAAVTASAEQTAEDTRVEFSGLNLGYYLVDSSLGALCSLDTTNPTTVIREKNEVPSVDKLVQEDSKVQETGQGWGSSNDADIGQTVNFMTTIHAKAGAQNYVLHDSMSDGLTLDADSIQVYEGSVEAENLLTQGTQYTLVTNSADDCDFEIAFSNDYLLNDVTQAIVGDDEVTEVLLIVTYSAVLNEQALIYDEANTNDAWLDYGDESSTEETPAHTDTYTYQFDIIKTNSKKELIDGAVFELYDAETGGNQIALVKENGAYRRATEDEMLAQGFASAQIQVGRATVTGLDGGTTYYLEELQAPNGYNKLAERVPVRLEASNLTTAMEANATAWKDGDGGVQITNVAGAMLPSTGGIGTTVFYIIGGILVAAAIILLIVKKRMYREK